ncbi:MAG: glycosyltransferase family 4 protein [Candidatus Saccharimonadales bacterium]
MISFVWAGKDPFWAGRGGSENYTAGQVRELMHRGIPTRIITFGFGDNDGRDDFPDITFKSIKSQDELRTLDDTLVGVTYPIAVPTRRQAYVILHCPLNSSLGRDPLFNLEAVSQARMLAPSRFAAKMWGTTMHMRPGKIPAVYPFAETVFSQVRRPANTSKKVRILFGGRLTVDKGVYTLLAALHMPSMAGVEYEITTTTAASNTGQGPVIRKLLEAHPMVKIVEARRSPQAMAELMAEHDILVMPSSDIFWKEIFGIVAVEAQHAGCRVVASNAGGIPETDCGGLVLVKPDDPQALANGLVRAAYLGPLTEAERMYATSKFTVGASVDKLLAIMAADERRQPLLQKQGTLVRQQLDFAINTISELGLRVAGDKQPS